MTSILGKTADGPIRSASQIELWPLAGPTTVTYSTHELQALCPVTRQPDLYTATITYTATVTFESKGMKHYLWSFRDVGISCEDLAGQIARDLSAAIAETVEVALVQQVRGGLTLTAKAAQ